MNPFDAYVAQKPAAHWSEARKNAWQQVMDKTKDSPLLSNLVSNHTRNSSLTRDCAGIHIDCSRHRIDQDGLERLYHLLESCEFSTWRTAMFNGSPINHTEDRAVLHTALRDISGKTGTPEPKRKMVKACLEQMSTLANRIRNGEWTTHSGQAVTDVVNIGIGGSDLGPRMVTRALEPFCTNQPRVHFIANADPADLGTLLPRLNPNSTLFIICSKSFSTQETKLNAERARAWLQTHLDQPDLSKHFIGVTTNHAAATEFGLDANHLLPMWDWVGGRYSVWSAIGLSVMIAIGPEHFTDFLRGAAATDHHFLSSDLKSNAPVLLALLSFLYSNVCGAQSHAIVPYATLMEHFPSYLQQLVMESNGKSQLRNGETATFTTSPIIWGYIGTNSQHSFHQLLHQGTHLIPVDFILPETNHYGSKQDQNTLKAHCLAQMQALLSGRDTVSTLPTDADENTRLIAQHRMMSGNRPSTLLSLPALDPYHLGALIALYEHKTFVEACLWDINAYDQWGVELGKVLSANLETQLNAELNAATSTDDPALDAATRASLNRCRSQK